MNCSTRMSSLEPPLTTIFGVMFISISVFASVTNGFVLFVLWKPGRKVTTSTKILTSLAVSDFLVGMILSPLTSWQVLSKSLNDCRVEYTRRYLVLLLTGSSVLTLGLISYDRYILLLKLSNYSKYMTRWKLNNFSLICLVGASINTHFAIGNIWVISLPHRCYTNIFLSISSSNCKLSSYTACNKKAGEDAKDLRTRGIWCNFCNWH